MKKVLCIGLLFFVLFTKGVSARILSMEEVSQGFNQFVEEQINTDGLVHRSTVNTENSTFEIYENDVLKTVIPYTESYMEYQDRNSEINADTIEKNAYDSIYSSFVFYTILQLSGYSVTPENFEDVTDFDTYGILIETEPYVYQEGNSTLSGDYLRYLKMSLDTDKIDALVRDYGVNENELVPTITSSDITAHSVKITPYVEGEDALCYIYRSTSRDGEYEKITEFAVNCSGDLGVVDDNLQSGATYYYKAITENGTTFSTPLEVKTLVSDGEVENPQTGANIPIKSLLFLGICAVILFIYSTKKTKFKHL